MDVERVRAVVTPVADDLGLELYDVVLDGATVRVLVDREGGVDLDALTTATRALSHALEEAGDDRALEVSSPGLERPLRTTAHFRGATGETVTVRARDAAGEVTRHRGVLRAAADDGIVLEIDGREVRVPVDDVVEARTVFEWGPAPKPGKQSAKHKKKVSS